MRDEGKGGDVRDCCYWVLVLLFWSEVEMRYEDEGEKESCCLVFVIGVRWRCEPRDHGQEEGGCPKRLCCCLAFLLEMGCE